MHVDGNSPAINRKWIVSDGTVSGCVGHGIGFGIGFEIRCLISVATVHKNEKHCAGKQSSVPALPESIPGKFSTIGILIWMQNNCESYGAPPLESSRENPGEVRTLNDLFFGP